VDRRGKVLRIEHGGYAGSHECPDWYHDEILSSTGDEQFLPIRRKNRRPESRLCGIPPNRIGPVLAPYPRKENRKTLSRPRMIGLGVDRGDPQTNHL
jgi:hypothetical protein